LHHVANKEILEFDWDTFSRKMKIMFDFSQKNSIVAINADRWEEFIYVVLKNMGMTYKGKDPKWTLGSHKPGADLWIDQFSISAKSGNIQNGNLVLSSYRLTRFGNLNEMVEFIDSKEGKNFDIYLCSARIDRADGGRTYKVFLVDANIFYARNLRWEDMHLKSGGTHSGWRGLNEEGLKVEIRRKMSNQLWISIPIRMCNELLEISISKRELGLDAEKPLL
jgi:hypothetical protein